MGSIDLGRILTLLGLILVLLTGWGRRRARQQQQTPSPALLKLQSWGSLAAFGMILSGLILMNYSAR